MIKFEDVFFQYSSSKKTALSNINLEIKEGHWLSVLGKNGSGKSTLMKLIYGQNLATSGKVLFNNKEYSKEIYDDIKNKIAIVFQNPDNQFVGSTVEEDIAFGLENRNVPQEKMDEIIDRVLEIVDMTDYRKYEPSSLSGGQKQRVAIASALLSNKKILIFDEPTSGLDYVNMIELSHLIEQIAKNDVVIFIITHDYEFLCQVSDEVLYFDKQGIKERIEVNENNKNKILEMMS